MELDWKDLPDVAVDAQGRYLVVSASERRVSLTCLDPSLEPVWCNRELDFDSGETRVAPAPDGRVIVWQPGRASAVVLDERGQVIGALGAREQPDAAVPAMDFTDARDLVVDTDGTFLMMVSNRLQRFDGDGVGIHTWPQTGLRAMFHNKLEPLYLHRSETDRTRNDYDDHDVFYWGRRPLAIAALDVRGAVVGGALYLLTDHDPGGDAVARLDRHGRCRWNLIVRGLRRTRPAVDAAGQVYVITSREHRHRVHRIAADGSNHEVIAEDWRDGGPIDDPRWITVTPDGTVGVWDNHGELVLIGADRRVTYVSPAQEREIAGHQR